MPRIYAVGKVMPQCDCLINNFNEIIENRIEDNRKQLDGSAGLSRYYIQKRNEIR